eukprot:CAMPEP_0179090176 /NCGR_PEP_ID=MMETSP0796-20121207/41127_1 /TAXON_ID=73915 /ORGANISM="Pyrodinium bahamense, Strain pbaha01" /LENGTH=68 /DNA_ID=CAMNT_0020787743 /DNA_START=39 /DNA_END=242 /DNA_ORIENTATION=-
MWYPWPSLCQRHRSIAMRAELCSLRERSAHKFNQPAVDSATQQSAEPIAYGSAGWAGHWVQSALRMAA